MTDKPELTKEQLTAAQATVDYFNSLPPEEAKQLLVNWLQKTIDNEQARKSESTIQQPLDDIIKSTADKASKIEPEIPFNSSYKPKTKEEKNIFSGLQTTFESLTKRIADAKNKQEFSKNNTDYITPGTQETGSKKPIQSIVDQTNESR